jgi:rare lipoprotein A
MFRFIFAVALLRAPLLAYAETCIAFTMEQGMATVAGARQPRNPHVTVTHLGTSRSITVRINDRGSLVRGRCIDLSFGAARALGMACMATDRPVPRSVHMSVSRRMNEINSSISSEAY